MVMKRKGMLFASVPHISNMIGIMYQCQTKQYLISFVSGSQVRKNFSIITTK